MTRKGIYLRFLAACVLAFTTACNGSNTDELIALLTPPEMPEEFVGSVPTTEFESPGTVTVYDDEEAYDGLTIVVDSTQDIMFVIDMDGTVVRAFPAWDENYTRLDYAKPLDGGLLVTYPRIFVPDGDLITDSRVRKLFTLDATDGQQLFDYAMPDQFGFLHHDFQLLENGNYLLLASPKPFTTWSNISVNPVRDDVVFELNPLTGEVLWLWSTATHYSQLPATQDQRDFIVDQTRIDIFHTNSMQSLPEAGYDTEMYPEFTPGNILLGQRESNFVFILNPETGDIVWSLDHDTIGNIGQHHPRMIPTGLPGAGNILIFDNGFNGGWPRENRGYSRVLEIDPVTQTIVWSYDPDPAFDSPIRSGAQRLPNGNTLVSASQENRAFEVTPSGEIVWEFQQTSTNGHYRCHRVDYEWLEGGDTGPVRFPW